jgi:glycosyltransferase involved in cell wall biosynthesis
MADLRSFEGPLVSIQMKVIRTSEKADACSERVTAVIPTRGRPQLVVRAVQSALGQTYPNLDVVVVVDGADEATLKALIALDEPRLRVIAQAENVGGSEARNIGIRAARGCWVALLDDDDEWLPEKIAKQLAARPRVDVRHCLITCLRLERKPGHEDIVAPRRMPHPGEHVSEYLFYSSDGKRHTCGPQTSGFLGTKELFLDVPFSKGLQCHQDWDWYLRAIENRETVSSMVNEPLYVMHVDVTRPRMTDVARWKLALDWAESRKQLFTPRAYTSFLIQDTMHRCDETRGRSRIFLTLLGSCRRRGSLGMKDLFSAVKWWIFRPSVRTRILGSFSWIRNRRAAGDAVGHGLGPLESNREVQL